MHAQQLFRAAGKVVLPLCAVCCCGVWGLGGGLLSRVTSSSVMSADLAFRSGGWYDIMNLPSLGVLSVTTASVKHPLHTMKH